MHEQEARALLSEVLEDSADPAIRQAILALGLLFRYGNYNGTETYNWMLIRTRSQPDLGIQARDGSWIIAFEDPLEGAKFSSIKIIEFLGDELATRDIGRLAWVLLHKGMIGSEASREAWETFVPVLQTAFYRSGGQGLVWRTTGFAPPILRTSWTHTQAMEDLTSKLGNGLGTQPMLALLAWASLASDYGNINGVATCNWGLKGKKGTVAEEGFTLHETGQFLVKNFHPEEGILSFLEMCSEHEDVFESGDVGRLARLMVEKDFMRVGMKKTRESWESVCKDVSVCMHHIHEETGIPNRWEVRSIPEEYQKKIETNLETTKESTGEKKKGFLSKALPFLLAAGLATGGYFVYKSVSSEDEKKVSKSARADGESSEDDEDEDASDEGDGLRDLGGHCCQSSKRRDKLAGTMFQERPEFLLLTEADPEPGVGALPRGFSGPAAEGVPVQDMVRNGLFSLEKFWPANLSANPMVNSGNTSLKQGLLALALLHNFGQIGGLFTSNWLVRPLPPPCRPEFGNVELPGFNPPSCVQQFASDEIGVQEFLRYLASINMLDMMVTPMVEGQPDADWISATAFTNPDLSTFDVLVPGSLNNDNQAKFQEAFWNALVQVAQSMQTQVAWGRSGYKMNYSDAPTGSGGGSNQNLPTDPAERIRRATYLLSQVWPSNVLPVKDLAQTEVVQQGAVGLGLGMSDFGKVGDKETNNWFMVGDVALSASDCPASAGRVYAADMKRCVLSNDTAEAGAQYAVDLIVQSKRVRDAIFTGDVGRLVYAMMLDGWINPAPMEQGTWAALTTGLASQIVKVQQTLQQELRWKVTDFVPTEWSTVGTAPTKCPDGQQLVDGVCKPKEAAAGTQEEPKKSYFGWILAGAAAVGGALYLTRDEEKKPGYKGNPADFETKGYDQYGASMGRHGKLRRDTKSKLRTKKVPIDSQGYDPGGAYWGTPNNLWMVESIEGADEGELAYVRGADRDAVKRKFPHARWGR